MSNNKTKILEALKSLLDSSTFISLIEDALLKLLKAQLLGGFRGWLVRFIVKNFSEYVVEVLSDTTEYVIKSKKANDTITMEDRDEATDVLNDIMHN